jgi:hypothetical protein
LISKKMSAVIIGVLLIVKLKTYDERQSKIVELENMIHSPFISVDRDVIIKHV